VDAARQLAQLGQADLQLVQCSIKHPHELGVGPRAQSRAA
jgi:hypothetical protein